MLSFYTSDVGDSNKHTTLDRCLSQGNSIRTLLRKASPPSQQTRIVILRKDLNLRGRVYVKKLCEACFVSALGRDVAAYAVTLAGSERSKDI